MKKILLLDTAFAAMPIYEYLIRNGDEVWVMGNRSQDALAIRAGKYWIKQDYSKIDEVKKHINQYNIEYVVPGCTDTSIEVSLQLGINNDAFDDISTYNRLGNKKEFRKICSDLNLPSPRVVQIDDFPAKGKYICKPVDSFSGRGVKVVDGENLDETREAYENAMRESVSSKAIIETYAVGQLYSFSVFIEEGTVKEYFIVKEGSSVNPYAVDTSYVDDSLNESVIHLMRESIDKLSSELRLKDGLLHLQFILEDGKPYMIEVSRRSPGDLYALLIQYSTGYEYAAKYASFFISEHHDASRIYHKQIIRHTIASEKTVDFLSLKFIYPLQTYSYFPLLSLGNRVEDNQQTRVGIIFSEAYSAKQLEKDYSKFLSREVYKLNELE